jgi:hypothetical protein
VQRLPGGRENQSGGWYAASGVDGRRAQESSSPPTSSSKLWNLLLLHDRVLAHWSQGQMIEI